MPKAISIEHIVDKINGLPHVRVRFDNGDIVKPYSPNGVRISVEEWSSQ